MQVQGHVGRTAASTRKQAKTATASQRARPAVVLVEDDDDLRLVSAEVLRAAAFDVLECPNLLAAFVAVKSRVPDILLLDRELPDGSGLDLARWVRRRSSFDGVRVVVYSGRKTARDVEAALAAGCDAFVGKPCSPQTLVAEIEASTAPRQRRSGARP